MKKIGRAIEIHEKLYMRQVSKVSCFNAHTLAFCPNSIPPVPTEQASNVISCQLRPLVSCRASTNPSFVLHCTHCCTRLQLTKARALANRMREVSCLVIAQPHLTIRITHSGPFGHRCILSYSCHHSLPPAFPSLPYSIPSQPSSSCRRRRNAGRS